MLRYHKSRTEEILPMWLVAFRSVPPVSWPPSLANVPRLDISGMLVRLLRRSVSGRRWVTLVLRVYALLTIYYDLKAQIMCVRDNSRRARERRIRKDSNPKTVLLIGLRARISRILRGPKSWVDQESLRL